ncbi:MAG: immunoglobulin domain-containing protein [Verrucomicrobiaceae bacterium]|nr:immunoglobulin domain-containing protein [Verrucomicrobiaceae bacterium]
MKSNESTLTIGRRWQLIAGFFLAVTWCNFASAATVPELRAQVELKRQEWLKARNALTLLQRFSTNYSGRSQRLASDRAQVDVVRDRIASIQQKNLIKVTLQLGAETAQTMKDAVEVGTGAAAGVRALAEELLSNALKDQAKKTMGLDTETLTSPRTVRITGLNHLASESIPEIEAVKKLLKADLHTVRAREYEDRAGDPDYDMTKPGNDPRYWSDNAAILVKLERVKEALARAKEALEDIADELDATQNDTLLQLPEAEAEELNARDQLAFAQFALNDAINQEIAAERDAAAEARLNDLPDPVAEPPPYIEPKGEEESPEQYELRRIQTIISTADAAVLPLRSAINQKMADYNELIAQYEAKLDVGSPGAMSDMLHLGYLQVFVEVAGSTLDMADYATPLAAAVGHKDLKWILEQADMRMGAIPAASGQLDLIATKWQEANELRVQVSEWVQMAAAQGVTISYYSYDTPQLGTGVEGYIAALDEFSSGVSEAITKGLSNKNALQSRFAELNGALLAEVEEAGERLQQAEVGLAEMVAAAAAADQYLNASGWSWSYDVMPGEASGMSGYDFWGSGGHVYRTLTRRTFHLRTMLEEVMQALALPGEQAVMAYQQVMNKYGAFLTGFNAVNDVFHARYMTLRQDLENVLGTGYVSAPDAVAVIKAAEGANPDLPIPPSIPFAGGDLASASSSVDLSDRMTELNNSIATHWGTGTVQWLEEPTLDAPGFPFDSVCPAPTLLAIKQRALREIPTWGSLYFTPWKQKRDAWLTEMNNWHTLYFLQSPFNILYGMDAAWREQFLKPAEDQTRSDADLLFSRYPHIVDPPSVASMLPTDPMQKVFPGNLPEELRVVSFSERVSFQWYRRLNGGDWAPVKGATSWLVQPAYAEGVQEFYCRLSNTSGTAVSETRSVLGIRQPRMVKQPAPASISARTGATVVLTCALDETPAGGTKIVQWFKVVLDANGKPIIITSPWGEEVYQYEPLGGNPRMSGVWSTSLTITNFQPEDAGAYFVHVSNEFSYCQSALAWVKHVNTDVAPVFMQQPASQQALPGSMVTFQVQVNGSPAPQYLWKRNGVTLTNGPTITGANTTTLMLSNVLTSSSGSYSCTVTCGSKKGTSASGVLTVKEPAAPIVSSPPKSVTADPGASVSFSVAVKGGFPTAYVYQWQKEDSGSWADVPGFTSSAFNIIGITSDDAGRYRCVIGNGASGANVRTVVSSEATLILNGLPEITEDPDDAIAQYGSIVTFSGAASGIPAPTLQWYRVVDGEAPVAISGQTRSTLSLTLAGEPWASGSAFQVFLRAKNRFGAADSAMANLTIEDPFDSPASIGHYVGLIGSSPTLNNDLGGSIDLTLTRVGTYTGKVNLAGRSYSFKGTSDEQGVSDTIILRKGLPSLAARLTFDGNGALSGQLWQSGDRIPQELITASQIPWTSTSNPATAYVGKYTAALRPPSPLPTGAPEGSGWVKFSLAKTGAASGSGKLADGTPITLSSYLWPNGELPVFISAYSRLGSLLGSVDCSAVELDGRLVWTKKAATPATGRSYPSGIGPLDLTPVGSRYVAPARGEYLLGLSTAQAGNLTFSATGGGLGSPQSFAFTLSKAHLATFAVATKPSLPKLTFSASSGTVSGSFVVKDTQTIGGNPVTIQRTATLSGVLISPAGMSRPRIEGFFTLPGLLPSTSTSLILSGAAQVIIP